MKTQPQNSFPDDVSRDDTLSDDGFREIGNSNIWKPEKVDDSIRGIFYSKDENVGKNNNSTMYYIEKSDGEIMGVWGSAVLDSRMAKVEVGEEVVITYLGKTKSKAGNDMHNYRVQARKMPLRDV